MIYSSFYNPESAKPEVLRRTVDATVEPVTLAEAKAQCRVTHTEDDDYITALISAARQWAEDHTKRAFNTQTWVAGYSRWPCNGVFVLARPNVIGVSTLTYRSTSDVDTTVTSTNYQTELLAFPGEVKLLCSYVRPTLQVDRLYPITITFTAGYGATAASVPKKIKQAILIMIHHMYDNRLPVAVGTIVTKMPLSAESLLSNLRYWNT